MKKIKPVETMVSTHRVEHCMDTSQAVYGRRDAWTTGQSPTSVNVHVRSTAYSETFVDAIGTYHNSLSLIL